VSERGLYIVLEGSDGTGKSLQAELLTQKFESIGRSCLRVFNDETGFMEPVQEPGGTPKANELRRKIKDKTIPREPWQNVEWFTEARMSIWEEAILPALESGVDVITARSWVSTAAYQGYGQGIDLETIRNYTFEKVGKEYMEPNLICILALEDEIIRRKRLGIRSSTASQLDTFESMDQEFQDRMQTGYIRFAEDNNLRLVDASKSIQQVESSIWKQTELLLLAA
jgi:dTMP kinase